MSLGKRLRLLFEAKSNEMLDSMEDPTQVMNLSYEKQLEQLQNLRRAIAQVATEERHIELLEGQVQTQADQLTTQAQQALQMGREDLARQALQRRAALFTQIEGYKTQLLQLQAQQTHLQDVATKGEIHITTFRSQKELLSAQYGAAQASIGATEAVTGLSSDMGEMHLAMQRAQEKVLHVQAHADALDALMTSGSLSAPGEDPLDQQLRQITEEQDVERYLAGMREQLQLPAPKQES